MRCSSISLWVEFLYGQTSRLYFRDGHVMSSTGVQQGVSLGSLLYALVLHSFIHYIEDGCELILQARYHDDGTIVGDSKEVVKDLDII